MTKRKIFIILALFAGLFIFAACGDDSNISRWRGHRGLQEMTLDGGFSLTVSSAREGLRVITVDMTEEELANIRVSQVVHTGFVEIFMTDGNRGVLNQISPEIGHIPNYFTGVFDARQLEAGEIRIEMRFRDVQNATVAITWR